MDVNVENDYFFIISYVEQCWPSFQITQQLLEHPTSDFVFEFYDRVRNEMQFLLNQMVDNKNTDTSWQLKSEGDQVFDLLRFINKYLRKLSFGQADCTLSLSDLYEPTAKRTKIRFKVLLNLLVFYEEKLATIKSIVIKRQVQVEEHVKRQMEKEQLINELGQEAEKLAFYEYELEKLQKEFAKSELRYTKMQQQKGDSERQSKKQQHDLKMFVDAYQNKHTLLTNIKTNMQHLNEQIVVVDDQRCLLELKDVLKKKLELNTNAGYSAANLESRKPTIERLLNIEEQIQSLDYEKLKILVNNVVKANAQLQSGESKYKEKIKAVQKLCETKLVYKENSKEKNEFLKSEMLRNRILMEQVEQEVKQIRLEESEEKLWQGDINVEKIILQGKISAEKQKNVELTSYIETFNKQCANMYSNILSVENNTTSSFNKNMIDIATALSDAVNGTGTNAAPSNCIGSTMSKK